MKKYMLFFLALCLVLGSISIAGAQEEAAVYPEVRIDPATGKPYNLEGATVYIYDYWSGEGILRSEEPTMAEQDRYDYEDWIQSTYNCTVIQKQKGDWVTQGSEFENFAKNPDGSYSLFIVEPGKTGTLITNGYAADWSQSTTVDTSDEHWNQSTVDSGKLGNSVFTVSASYAEPRQLIYFNKRLLEEAGINWNNIYDQQANGTWTWEAFEDVLKKAHRDTDNDGVVDVSGITGSSDDMYRISVFSNGGEFFSMDQNGELQVSLDSQNSRDALKWAQRIWMTYAYQQQPEDNWDYYKQAFKGGKAAFYMYQAYGGFSDYSELSGMEDEWGAVAFPKGPNGNGYVTIVSENATMIPNVYTQDELSKMTLIYELWTAPTPGYENSDSWIGNKYNYTDDRAVDETYGMLIQNGNQVTDKTSWLGTVNDVLGVSLLWNLSYGSDVDAMIDAGIESWQALCDEVNNKNRGKYEVTLDLSGYPTITLPEDVLSIGEGAFTGVSAQVIVVPSGCTTIEDFAFSDATELKYVVLPASITEIGLDAFMNCPDNLFVLVQKGSYAAGFCSDVGLDYLFMASDAKTSADTQLWVISIEY